MPLDLQEIERDIDNLLENETTESLTAWYKIKQSLIEVRQIERGQLKGKTMAEFLEEL